MDSKTPAKKPVIIGGVVVLLVGVVLLLWGIAPAKGFSVAAGAFGGGPVPDDLGDQISATMDELGSRVWAMGLGFVLLLGGVIAISAGKPQDKPVDQQVKEAVEERLAQAAGAPMGASLDTGRPAAQQRANQQAAPASQAPTDSTPVATAPPAASPAAPAPAPAAAEASGPRCTTCGSLKVAGGRLCPRCR